MSIVGVRSRVVEARRVTRWLKRGLMDSMNALILRLRATNLGCFVVSISIMPPPKSKVSASLKASIAGCLLLLVLVGGVSATESTFTNPIYHRAADPWVLQYEKDFVYCYSRDGHIHVARTNRLERVGLAPGITVWTPPQGQPYSRELWAPELHRLQERFYIYVAADDGANRNHRMWVLEGDSKDPQKPFQLKGKIASADDHWAIDGTVLSLDKGRLYFIWSGWEGNENVRQNLYIAPMSNPWTISGPRTLISTPTLAWELHGKPLINEGPEVLLSPGGLFIIYSASGSWTDDYCLGQLRFMGGDPLQPDSWKKHPSPVFSRTASVFGPGHASFVKSLEGEEDWILYHAARRRGSGWERDLRLQRFHWNADGSPNFGVPAEPGQALAVPRFPRISSGSPE